MKTSVVDHSFMDARSKLLDLAAFLDRAQRHGEDGDFRVQALRAGIDVLTSRPEARVRSILELLSDPTTEPVPAAATKGAVGAYLKPL